MQDRRTPAPASLQARLAVAALSTLSLLTLPSLGCSESGYNDFEGEGGDGSSLGSGVGQGGAQDFGLFREILLEGGIPGPNTIDDVGFFAEHQVPMPTPDCGEDVCIHGLLGVMGNMISGSNCTVVLVGMNTPIDADALERPPLNLTIAVDLSGSMEGEPLDRVREGLLRMRNSLEPGDHVSLVGFGDDAELIVEHVAGDSVELATAIAGLESRGSTNIYAGLRTAFEVVQAHAQDGYQNRVVLVSDGLATIGLTSSEKIEGLATAWADLGYGLTTIGLGNDFDVDLMRSLAELGSGSFYYVEDYAAVEEVFEEEVQAFVVPLAQDVTIDATVFAGYDLRNIYGTKQAEVWGNHGHIDIPILQIAHRVSDDDNEKGRRGGGGAMILELTPTGDSPGEVGRIELEYQVPGSEELVEQVVEISSPLGPWETPDNGWFTNESVEKGFVMLNIYVAFEMAATRASKGDDAGALSILRPLALSLEAWLEQSDDADIEDDLFYVYRFIENIEARGSTTNSPNPVPPEPWPAD
ncbi:von Willebrand factor type A domain protein [Enhygromyxa salina]|uniref:von Willebrand factor type A domain protein n=1 Tax=Enhygromyxa salina TaxID=215803 RepID=A0A2S9XV59_9BACT|nr:VWA domain-containing protein [Enhygromyxa salina]PRP96745.1 von Willebrand factor type A domain protein [Enhygromyxa salina]